MEKYLKKRVFQDELDLAGSVGHRSAKEMKKKKDFLDRELKW